MPRFFLSPHALKDGQARVEGQDAHHLRRVLRLDLGDRIEIAVAGLVYEAALSHFDDNAVVVDVVRRLSANHEPPLAVTLWQGLCKGDKPELITQKAVELGVSRVVFFESRFSVVRWPRDKAERKIGRLQRVAAEAGKQSQRDVIPQVQGPQPFSSVVRELAEGPGLVLMPWESERTTGLQSLDVMRPRNVSVLIGPEGGFHPDEVQAVREIGGHTLALGPRILRTETAGLVILAIIGYRWGDLGSA